jgi:RNA polymerase sigma factor for flagellar operon FliA
VETERALLIEEHITLVDHVVRRVASTFPGYVDRGELMSAGRLGLTEAACRFDFTRSVPFAPYAARRIRGSVLDHLRTHDWVPRSVRDLSRRADRVAADMDGGSGADVDHQALADRLDVDPERLRDARAAGIRGRVGSLDSATDPSQLPHDVLTDRTVSTIEEVLENRELHGYLRGALDSLPERLRMIVVGHYLEGRSLDRLADDLGLTPSRVSQLRADAIEIVRDGIEAQFRSDEVPAHDAAPPKGRVAIRQAQFAASVARHSDWRARLSQQTFGSALAPPARPGPEAEVNHGA